MATNTWRSKKLWIFYHKWHGCPFVLRANLATASVSVLFVLELGKVLRMPLFVV